MPPIKKRKKVFYSDIFKSEHIAYYKSNWIGFIEDYILADNEELFLSDQQKQLIAAVQNNKRVSIKSGRGIGKTFSMASLILTFMSLYPDPKVVCTAPTYGTLQVALWPEVARWLKISMMKDIFEHTSDSLYLIEQPKDWKCYVRTAREKENISGLHADNMLIVVDEASGLKPDIFEALDTTLTGANNKIVMIGNPTQVSGPFFDSFHTFKKRWVNLTFNSEESPFVQKEQIDYYIEKYGKNHDLYKVNILGEFPSGSPDAFIKLSDINEAVSRYEEVSPSGDIEIGLDVARFGDDLTVLYWRHGYKVYPAKTLAKSSVQQCRDLVLETVEEIRRSTGYEKKIRVKVDSSGVGGGVEDLLKEDREHNIEVIPCNFGGKGDEKYQNEASIMWANIRDNINIIGLPDDKHLVEELSSRRWRLSNNGKIMIEPKSEYKKDFKSSPDRADALVLCFARKEAEDVVLKNFDTLDKTTVKQLHYTGEEKFASIYYGKDMTVSVTYVAWDGIRAYVYDELVWDDSLVTIATHLLNHQGLTRIIGNDKMFNYGGLGIDTKYRKYGVNIKECYDYDQTVGIDALMSITSQRRLIINPSCKKTIDQLSSWKIDKNSVKQERDFGLCYSLAHIMFLLRKKNIGSDMPKIFDSYKSVKDNDLTNVSCTSWLKM